MVGVVALLVEQRGPVGLGLGRASVSARGAGRPRRPSLGDELGPLDEGVDHLVLGHDRDDLALDEQVAPLAAGGDAEVGLAGLARAVHHAAHHRDLDRDASARRAPSWASLGDLDDVDLGPAARRAGDQVEVRALPQAERLEQLAPGLGLLDRDRR